MVTKKLREPGLRKVYKRNGVVHVCGAGKLFGAPGNTKAKPGSEVVVIFAVDGSHAAVKTGWGPTEKWAVVTIPTKAEKAEEEMKALSRKRSSDDREREKIAYGVNIFDIEE